VIAFERVEAAEPAMLETAKEALVHLDVPLGSGSGRPARCVIAAARITQFWRMGVPGQRATTELAYGHRLGLHPSVLRPPFLAGLQVVPLGHEKLDVSPAGLWQKHHGRGT
jgi:hypothetical protein